MYVSAALNIIVELNIAEILREAGASVRSSIMIERNILVLIISFCRAFMLKKLVNAQILTVARLVSWPSMQKCHSPSSELLSRSS
jgi:hypothetical protein